MTPTLSYSHSDLLALPLRSAVLRLAWPTMLSLMAVNLFNLVDAYWVGKLGSAALGGMTASAFLVWCAHSAAMLVGSGVVSAVARRIGAGRPELAAQVGRYGVLLALLVAFAVATVGLAFQPAVFAAMGLSAAAQGAASAYVVPIFWGMPAITLWYAIEAIFRGSGNTRTPMWILAGSLMLNAGLDPILIFGVGPFRGFGIAGAGWATVLAHALGVGGGWFFLARTALWPGQVRGGQRLRLDFQLLREIVSVGAPVAANAIFFALVYLLLTRLIAPYGNAAVAGLGVGHRIEGLGYYVCLGFSGAAATLVGQSLGAGRPVHAQRAAWLATRLAVLVVGVLSLVTFVAASPLVGIFSGDPQVVAAGAAYSRTIALLEIGMALEVVLEGAFAGAGNALPPLLIGVPLTGLRIPVAYWLAEVMGLGLAGIWWTISLSTGLKGLLIALWFRRGRWARHAPGLRYSPAPAVAPGAPLEC